MKDSAPERSLTEYSTPMMKQYRDIKKKYPDTLLFFRLGDFYELFLDDAEVGSRILDITLTARSKGKDGKIPMCGVPYHAIDSYLGRIVKAGYKAAICEQISEPEKGVEIVEREVVRVVTPGTVTSENMLNRKENNYVLTMLMNKNEYSIGYADISTGDFCVFSGSSSDQSDETIISEIKRINPSEIVLDLDLYENYALLKKLQNSQASANIFKYEFHKIKTVERQKNLENFFKTKSLAVFDIPEDNEILINTAGYLLEYLQYTQKDNLFHIRKIINVSNQAYMKLGSETILNLEILSSLPGTIFGKKDTCLVSVIDKTSTSMGARLLRRWLVNPLIEKSCIENRLNAVEEFIKNHLLRDKIEGLLRNVLDIERILSRLATQNSSARDLLALNGSLQISSKVIAMIESNSKILNGIGIKDKKDIQKANENIKNATDIINKTFSEDPPVSVKEGRMIKTGVSQELDDLKSSISDSKEWIAELEEIERKRTKISTLKVGFNSVFGYYIEISKANSKMAPENYIRKQTLVNAERYITDELKYKEEIVLNAETKINELEYEIFKNAVSKILEYAEDIQFVAQLTARIDCLKSFASLALEKNYTKPKITESSNYDTSLVEARHPVVESVLETGEFTPNTTKFTKRGFIHLITGPNMSGKSTYIRQTALIQILAQIGSYVPAYEAEISIVDGIYTRIGAGDALAQGLSTFMVEMIEVAKILNNATKNSLIILDEVGRGTSTIDGLSIAKAVVEYIHNKIGAKTLFATHFHELINLDQRLKKVENYHIKVAEDKGEIRFLHKVEKGGTDKSYGVEVARLAGVPEDVVKRAKELLDKNTTDQLKLDI